MVCINTLNRSVRFDAAGRKALAYSQQETSVLRQLRIAAGCSTIELPAAFEKVVNHSNELAKEISRLWTLFLPNFVKTAQFAEFEGSKVGIQITQIPRPYVAKLAALIASEVGGAGIVVSDRHIAVSSGGISAKDIQEQLREVAQAAEALKPPPPPPSADLQDKVNYWFLNDLETDQERYFAIALSLFEGVKWTDLWDIYQALLEIKDLRDVKEDKKPSLFLHTDDELLEKVQAELEPASEVKKSTRTISANRRGG